MQLNQAGIDLIKTAEGLRLNPYLDSQGIPTIGYGNTFYSNGTKVTLNDPPITKNQADELFNTIVQRFALSVKTLIKAKLNDNQFSALVSFAYNLGIKQLENSTLLKLVNTSPSNPKIENEFNKWVYAGNRILNGLVTRRKAEAKLYFS